MVSQEIFNLCVFVAICIAIYILFNTFYFKEGLTSSSSSSSSTRTSSSSGSSIQAASNSAANAANYAEDIKNAATKLTDVFLINKYRHDYENVILNLDTLIESLMLNEALSVNINNPYDTINNLATLNSAKDGLNNVMKFVDASK